MKEENYLFRIMPLRYVVDLFESRELHFTSPRSWDDPYERFLNHRGSQHVFAQCWCKRSVSDAMWRIYSSDFSSLRISTTREKLMQVGARIKATSVAKYKLQDVEYRKENDLHLALEKIAEELHEKFSMEKAMEALFIKRDAFDFESEVRAIAFLQPSRNEIASTALRVGVDPHNFVESITFDPRADPAYIKVVTFFLRKSINFTGKIFQSSLYRSREIVIPY